jgi:hypothetical protein
VLVRFHVRRQINTGLRGNHAVFSAKPAVRNSKVPKDKIWSKTVYRVSNSCRGRSGRGSGVQGKIVGKANKVSERFRRTAAVICFYLLQYDIKTFSLNHLQFFPRGAADLSGPGPPHYRGFTITLRHTPQSVGLLWTSDQPDAETSTWQQKHSQETDIHFRVGIRTRDTSKRSAADPLLRPRSHWEIIYNYVYLFLLLNVPRNLYRFSFIVFLHIC